MAFRTAFCLAAVVSAAWAPSATAAPATPEEAQRLLTMFERYLGKPTTPAAAAVRVTPEGEAYRFSVDLTALMAPLAKFGLTVKAGDLVSMLTPTNDGLWHVTSAGFPPISLTGKGQTFSATYADAKFDGLFDPKIRVFQSSTSTSTGNTFASVTPQGSNETRTTGQSERKSTAVDEGDGSVNAKTTQTIAPFGYKLEFKPVAGAEGAAPTTLSIDAHAEGATTTVEVRNDRTARLLDLWAFVVAHPSKETLIADQGELKTLLTGLLPYGSSFNLDGSVQKLAVSTPQGNFGVGTFSEQVAVGKDVAKDAIALGVQISGLTLPAGLVPNWSTGFVPTGLDIKETIGPLHINDGLLKAVAALDLSRDQPISDADVLDISRTIYDAKELVLTLAPSTITSPLLQVKLEGRMQLTQPMPTLAATVTATGVDKAIDVAQAAAQTDPAATQVFAMLSAAKLFGKATGEGNYTWLIESKPGGDILVNGKSLQAAPPTAVAPPAKTKKKPAPKL